MVFAGQEDDLDVGEVVRDEFDGVKVVEDEAMVVELVDDNVHDEDAQDVVPEEGVKYKLASMYSTMPLWSISASKMRR